MAAFKTLKDVCANFDAQIEEVSQNLFSAKIPESSEEVLLKKRKDFDVYSTKYRLLNAKTTATTPQIVERVRNGANIIDDYEEAVQGKILERALVKSVTQRTAVRKLLATPDRKLDLDSLTRKQEILEYLKVLNTNEDQLRQMDSILQEKRDEHAALRSTWDQELGQLRGLMAAVAPEQNVEASGPLYDKLKLLISKMEEMSWLIGRLVTGSIRHYDWIADPQNLLSYLPLTRNTHQYTLNYFINQ